MRTKRNQNVPRLKRPSRPADDTLVSDAIMQDVLKRVSTAVPVKRSYDVPYLGGSSRRGTVYIDRKLPKSFRSNGRRLAPDPFIVIHEAVERVVGDGLRLSYQHAHQIALRVEEAAVRAAGVSWKDYNDFTREHQETARASFSRLPPDLDLKPYQDENDTQLLHRIRSLQKQGICRRRHTGRAPKRKVAP